MTKRKRNEIEREIEQEFLDQGLDINHATIEEIEEFFAEMPHLDCPSLDDLMDQGYTITDAKTFIMMHHKLICPSMEELMLEGYSKEDAAKQLLYTHVEEAEECLADYYENEANDVQEPFWEDQPLAYEEEIPLASLEVPLESIEESASEGMYFNFTNLFVESEFIEHEQEHADLTQSQIVEVTTPTP
ncbi:hypothetical protein [Candidatus Berkiella aquae]|uniref:Uncharacterized protein n=1 Tax=Candidatus Berkiella aquae TaxID=295108 RepID=A0A0Q9YRW3_9GAMM|nr:hypothetical protein [Candidatus Berkiella aquae]MCS5711742.1 hypothetical protein [Candidatus Berkiella aquae]